MKTNRSKKIGYGENFRPYTKNWIDGIPQNINLAQFDGLVYQAKNRAIAIDNLHARLLPTDDVFLYHYKLAGEGYPFDNLQTSALWAGTPVYIVAESRDHAWSLVITPDYISWVKSNGIARVDNQFVETWTNAANVKLAAITRTQTAIVDENEQFHFSAYIGSVFPANGNTSGINLMIPVADENHRAVIKMVSVSSDSAAIMPITATPHHFANIMHSMIGRPYGWGSMYFITIARRKRKVFLTPFGIWVPRHSSNQVTVGKMVDMSSASPERGSASCLFDFSWSTILITHLYWWSCRYVCGFLFESTRA